jgi:tetratricopeptide (TPR) repeat protein
MESPSVCEPETEDGRDAEGPAGAARSQPDLKSQRALLQRLRRALRTLDRERSEAPSLCSELLGLPRDEQGERIERDARFHTWGVCELLLGLSVESEDAEEAVHLAGLTLLGAARLDTVRHVASVIADLQARAWAALGECRRAQGRQSEAEDALRAAASFLAHGTGDLLVEAHLLEFEARVRRDQQRLGEASALLKLAAARYREAGDGVLCDRALALRNEILQLIRPF